MVCPFSTSQQSHHAPGAQRRAFTAVAVLLLSIGCQRTPTTVPPPSPPPTAEPAPPAATVAEAAPAPAPGAPAATEVTPAPAPPTLAPAPEPAPPPPPRPTGPPRPPPPPPPPPGPIRLSATPLSSDRIGLAWEPPPPGPLAVAAYEVLLGEEVVARVVETRAELRDLEPARKYCFAVRAVDAAGATTRPSAQACATTLEEPPRPPSDVQVSPLPGNRAEIRWTPPRRKVAGYDLLRGSERVEMVAGTQYTDARLTPDREHCYTLRSFDEAGNRSEASAPACLTIPDTTPPSTPAGLTARAPTETEVQLSWSAATDDVGVVRYEVLRVGGGSLPTTTATQASEIGLTAGARRCYAVRACDRGGNCSAPSAQACAVTADLTPPAAPAGLTAGALEGRVELRWEPSTDNVGVTGYEILRAGKVEGRAGPTPGYTVGDLRSAVRYCYVVRALDAAGNRSPPSSEACATLPDLTPPTMPGNPATTPVSESRLYVAWDPATDDAGVTAYEVLGGDSVVARTAETWTVVSGLSPRAQRCFRIRAVDAAGNRSPPSSEACGTPGKRGELAAPDDLRVRRLSPTSVALQWEPSERPGVIYRVYARGKEVGLTGIHSFTAAGKLGGESSCFSVSVADGAGRETPPSKEVCAQPSPAR